MEGQVGHTVDREDDVDSGVGHTAGQAGIVKDYVVGPVGITSPHEAFCSVSTPGAAAPADGGDERDDDDHPYALWVVVLNGTGRQVLCSGLYGLVNGLRPKGNPLWKNVECERWLCYGTDEMVYLRR